MRQNIKEKEEQFKDCPKRTRTYEVDGVRYHVTSHFIGTKDLDETINQLAREAALHEDQQTV